MSVDGHACDTDVLHQACSGVQRTGCASVYLCVHRNLLDKKKKKQNLNFLTREKRKWGRYLFRKHYVAIVLRVQELGLLFIVCLLDK